MDFWHNVTLGFSVAATPFHLLLAFIGVFLGTVIGVLPGIGPMTGVALLIPLTFGMNPTSAIILLAGIYYGAMYGGSTTSILVNTPGESSSVVTCLDGYQMAKKGRAGPALAAAAIGSFIAGTFATLMLMLFGPWVAHIALKFGPPEFFSLMVAALTLVTSLAGRSLVKALLSTLFGLAIATIGIDLQSGVPRYTFGNPELMDGLEFLVVAIGLFALSEVLVNLADTEESRFVKGTFQMGLAEEPKEKEKDVVAIAAMRDSIITLLSSKTADQILTPQGKDKLREEIRARVNVVSPQIKVLEVFIVDFVVQL